ncbi:hypothetical protein MYXO_03922 [Myxococcaceae bacterium]|nr:hypothetical protein MYXO_03922 [Myxococcaceae bacterium]
MEATIPGLDRLREKSGLVLTIGVVLVLLGTAAIFASVAATVASVLVFAWLLLFGGLAQLVHAFSHRDWQGFLFELLVGVLYLVTGVLLLQSPLEGAATLTLLMAAFFFVGGLFRIGASIGGTLPHRGFVALSGVVNVVLGGLILAQWPESGLWVIGLFVGIDLAFAGWTLVTLALAVRRKA